MSIMKAALKRAYNAGPKSMLIKLRLTEAALILESDASASENRETKLHLFA